MDETSLHSAIDAFGIALSQLVESKDLLPGSESSAENCLVCGSILKRIPIGKSKFTEPFCGSCFKTLEVTLGRLKKGFEVDY